MLILSSCNGKLGNCCNDYAIVPILSILKSMMNIIQIIVPILLILMATIQMGKLVINPEESNGVKKVINKFVAAAIVFFLPLVLNVTLNMMPSSFSINNCWKAASNKKEIVMSSNHKYKEIKGEKSSEKKDVTSDPSKYDKGSSDSDSSSGGTSSYGGTAGNGSVKGQAIANYALQFVGEKYVHGGKWNGERPYKGTDCIGFVRGVFKHFGYDITSSRSKIIAHSTKVDKSNAQAGDIVIYDGHFALATGKGYQIVHAANPRSGVVVSKDLRKCGKPLIGVYRYNY